MIYIVRHGQTQMNSAHALQGRSNLPMNEHGVEQANTVARQLRERGISFARVYASPLQRAVHTARIIAPEAEPVLDDRLLEMDYGPYEGTDLTNIPPELQEFFRDFAHNPAPEGMEQLSSVVERAGSFVEDIRALPGDILVSTHAIAMKGILEYLTPGSNGSYWSKFIGNCAVYAAEVEDGQIGIPHELVLES